MNRDDVLFFLSGSEEEQILRFSPDVIIPLSIPQDSDSDDENSFVDGEDTDFAPSSIVGVTESMPLQLLYSAYMQGVFPWFSEDDDEPVVWWCPSPRFVLLSENFHIPKSVKKLLKKKPFTYTFDECFETVIHECRAAERKGQDGTWIGEKIIRAYTALHRVGFAHSVEVWDAAGNLAGGFYGVLLGSVFCGESMFTKQSNATKCAFVEFAKAFFSVGGRLIDSQVYTDNIARYGAKNIRRTAFLRLESEFLAKPLAADVKTAFLQSNKN
mgnify:FL=1